MVRSCFYPNRTQGGALLCPGLSHFAPLGRGHHKPYRVGTVPGFLLGTVPGFLLVRFAALPLAAERNLELLPGFSKDLYGSWASYRLVERLAGSRHKEEGTPDTTPTDSSHSGEDFSHSGG
jgi:hypothetical protein